MAHLRNCILCGTEYDYCPRCDDTKPTFYLKYCGENCRDIDLILNRHAFKHLTDIEAADELKKCDLAKLDKFNKTAKEYIEKILESAKPAVVEVEAVKESEELSFSEIERVPVRRSRKKVSEL